MQGNEEVAQLQRGIQAALGLPAESVVAFVELHDALTTLRFHGKPLPAGLTPEMLAGIETEATRRFAQICAPQPVGPDPVDLLRLSLGQLINLLLERMDAAVAGDALLLHSFRISVQPAGCDS